MPGSEKKRAIGWAIAATALVLALVGLCFLAVILPSNKAFVEGVQQRAAAADGG
jgi:hypothetical protein